MKFFSCDTIYIFQPLASSPLHAFFKNQQLKQRTIPLASYIENVALIDEAIFELATLYIGHSLLICATLVDSESIDLTFSSLRKFSETRVSELLVSAIPMDGMSHSFRKTLSFL